MEQAIMTQEQKIAQLEAQLDAARAELTETKGRLEAAQPVLKRLLYTVFHERFLSNGKSNQAEQFRDLISDDEALLAFFEPIELKSNIPTTVMVHTLLEVAERDRSASEYPDVYKHENTNRIWYILAHGPFGWGEMGLGTVKGKPDECEKMERLVRLVYDNVVPSSLSEARSALRVNCITQSAFDNEDLDLIAEKIQTLPDQEQLELWHMFEEFCKDGSRENFTKPLMGKLKTLVKGNAESTPLLAGSPHGKGVSDPRPVVR